MSLAQRLIMSRKIIIDKWRNNTHYSVSVIDSYDQEHHLGYIRGSEIDKITTHICGEEQDILSQAEEIWNNEEELAIDEDLMSKAVAECIQMDIDRGVEPNLD